MRLGNLHEVEEERDRHTLVFHMDGDRDERAVVGGGPRIRCEVESPVVILSKM